MQDFYGNRTQQETTKGAAPMCRQHHQIGALMPHNLKHHGAWIAQARNRLHMESRKSLLGKCPQAALLVIVRLVFEVGVRVGQFPIGEEIRSIGMHQRHCGREPIRNFPDVGNNGPAGIGIVDREQDLAKRQHYALPRHFTGQTNYLAHTFQCTSGARGV